MSQDRKLGFQVVFASGEDPEYPVTELNFHSPQTRGWQSPRFGEYPQEIGIQFTDGLVQISQVQLLSHQSKIATKIELFQGTGDEYLSCNFTRLGYLSLDSNERSQYKVGLIAINVLGQPISMPAMPGRQLAGPAHAGARGGAGVHDLAVDMNMDPETAAVLREVVGRKEAAVANEEFELAKRLKVLQDGIKRVGGTLAGMAADKARAVDEEDYDKAARIKEEMGRIRSAIFEQMAELGLPLPPGAQTSVRGGRDPYSSGSGSGSGSGGGFGGPRGGPREVPDYGRPTPQPAPGGPGGYIDGYSSDGPGPQQSLFGSGREGGPPIADRMPGVPGSATREPPVMASAQKHQQAAFGSNAPGSADRPIRPAASTDIYARAGASPGGHGSGITPMRGEDGGRPASRPIRPARDGAVEEAYANDAKGGASPGVAGSPFGKRAGVAGQPPSDRADPSQLAGVDGAADLPAPDPLPGNPGEIGSRLLELYGDYVVRCYLSKAWNLREAAVLKMALETPNVANAGRIPGVKHEILGACAAVCGSILAKDRIANVQIAACHDLLPAVAGTCCSGAEAVRRGEAVQSLDPVLVGLVDLLGNNTPKVRESAVQAILSLATPEVLTVGHVAGALLKKPGKKQAGNLRGLQSKLEMLTLLIEQRNLLGSGGAVQAEDLVGFCEEHATFAHANGDIRHATLELMVAAGKVVGTGALEPMLQPLLRKKQYEEYQAAFANAGVAPGGGGFPGVGAGVGGGTIGSMGPGGHADTAKQGKQAKAQGKTAKGQQGGGGGGGGAPRPAPAAGAGAGAGAHAVHDHPEGEGEHDADPGVCQFCGGCGPNATEQELDLHYWQACPMLTSCGRCQQVIEIATLVEHLLDECEAKADYEACETCGDAILTSELQAHVDAHACKPQPDPTKASRCPLCHADIAPDKEGWLQHLLDQGCPANPRTNENTRAAMERSNTQPTPTRDYSGPQRTAPLHGDDLSANAGRDESAGRFHPQTTGFSHSQGGVRGSKDIGKATTRDIGSSSTAGGMSGRGDRQQTFSLYSEFD